MIQLTRTTSSNSDFITLVKALDQYLAIVDGEEHAFYDQFNKIENLNYVVVAYINNEAVGCGAIKAFNNQSMEVKRMFTKPASRGQGIAGLILNELEKWAQELNFSSCILETGKRQVEAVRLYTKSKYTVIPNYGQYQHMENSICFIKHF